MNVEVNLATVFLAAVANMVVGSLWYGPLFGKQWKHLMGFTNESMKKMKMTAGQAIFGGFITAFLTAYVLAHFALLWSATGLEGAFKLAFWVWLGFGATVLSHEFLWGGRPFKLFVLNAAQLFVSLFITAFVLVMWK